MDPVKLYYSGFILLLNTFNLNYIFPHARSQLAVLLSALVLPMIWMISASRTPSAMSCCKSLINRLWPDFAR